MALEIPTFNQGLSASLVADLTVIAAAEEDGDNGPTEEEMLSPLDADLEAEIQRLTVAFINNIKQIAKGKGIHEKKILGKTHQFYQAFLFQTPRQRSGWQMFTKHRQDLVRDYGYSGPENLKKDPNDHLVGGMGSIFLSAEWAKMSASEKQHYSNMGIQFATMPLQERPPFQSLKKRKRDGEDEMDIELANKRIWGTLHKAENAKKDQLIKAQSLIVDDLKLVGMQSMFWVVDLSTRNGSKGMRVVASEEGQKCSDHLTSIGLGIETFAANARSKNFQYSDAALLAMTHRPFDDPSNVTRFQRAESPCLIAPGALSQRVESSAATLPLIHGGIDTRLSKPKRVQELRSDCVHAMLRSLNQAINDKQEGGSQSPTAMLKKLPSGPSWDKFEERCRVEYGVSLQCHSSIGIEPQEAYKGCKGRSYGKPFGGVGNGVILQRIIDGLESGMVLFVSL